MKLGNFILNLFAHALIHHVYDSTEVHHIMPEVMYTRYIDLDFCKNYCLTRQPTTLHSICEQNIMCTLCHWNLHYLPTLNLSMRNLGPNVDNPPVDKHKMRDVQSLHQMKYWLFKNYIKGRVRYDNVYPLNK